MTPHLTRQIPIRARPFLIWVLGILLGVVSVGDVRADVDPTSYPLGASIVADEEGGGAVFRVWAPNATNAVVRGQFNGFSATADPMTKDAATDIWSAYVGPALAGQRYKFYFSDTLWRVDPRARDSGNSRDDDSILTDHGAGYPWQAVEWQPPSRDRMVIYELHVGTFSGNGDGVGHFPARYRDIVDVHLDHLKRLGINMVELMPIQEFNGDRSWGYNPLNFFAPETIYGDPDDLRYLVDTLHRNGIGVLLDVVYNHAATDTNLWQYDGANNPYFYPTGNCSQDTGYGSRPDYRKSEVRRFLVDSALMWMQEYRIDGFRFDLTSLMHAYCGEQGEGWNLLAQFTQELRAADPRVVLIAEELPNLGAVTTPIASGGRGFDAQWGDAFHDILRGNLTGTNNGTSPNMGAINSVVTSSGFGRPTSEAVKFSSNHDEAGNATRLLSAIDPADHFSARARGLDKIAGGLALLSPGIPMLFMGQEFHEDKQFDDGSGDRLWWGFAARYPGVIDYYGRLSRLRLERESLRAGMGVATIAVNESADVLAFQRYDSHGDVTVVIANLSGKAFPVYNVGVPSAGTWYELVNSEAPAFGGAATPNGEIAAAGPGLDGQPARAQISLPAYSLLVLSETPLASQPEGSAVWALY